MNFDELTSELKEKARACKTPEELPALAKQEGYELSAQELAAVTDGIDWWDECECDGSGYEEHDTRPGYRPFIP